MDRLKLITIVGTRPEIIKLSEIIKLCDTNFNQILVHTGQNYDYSLSQVFFDDLGIRKPDFFLGISGNNLGENIGNIISKSYNVLFEHKPDAVLLLGDTNSCLSSISAKRLKIPIFHMEAGNRCFDENLPEEINRRIVDHISDVNLCYSEHARRYLNFEGISPQRTFVVGSPMKEIFIKHNESILKSNILEKFDLKSKNYIVLSCHREENIDNERNFFAIMLAINKISEKYNMPIIFSTHPRTDKYIKLRNFVFHKNVINIKPLGFFDYINLQKNSFCVLSDSGTLAEEASFFKFPAISIRTSTERPEVIDKGNMIIGNISLNQILQSIQIAVNLNNENRHGSDVENYNDEDVSLKIVKIIQSYTEIINIDVWKKNEK